MKHIKTLNTQDIKSYSEKRRMRRVPDIMSVCVQDILYRRKSDLREQKIILLHVGSAANLPAGAKGNE